MVLYFVFSFPSLGLVKHFAKSSPLLSACIDPLYLTLYLHVNLAHLGLYFGSFTQELQDPKSKGSALQSLTGGSSSRERACFNQVDQNLMGQVPDEAVL